MFRSSNGTRAGRQLSSKALRPVDGLKTDFAPTRITCLFSQIVLVSKDQKPAPQHCGVSQPAAVLSVALRQILVNLAECKLPASVAFDPDTKISRFEGDAFSWSGLTLIHIPSSVEVICESCFCGCKSLASITFDADTKVSRFESYALRESGLILVHIPSSVEVICEFWFSRCKSLVSVARDPGLKLLPTLPDLLAGLPFKC
jgi:hypothetical protein